MSGQNRPDVLNKRRVWFEAQPDLDPKRLIFIDESWAKTNMTQGPWPDYASAKAALRPGAASRSARV